MNKIIALIQEIAPYEDFDKNSNLISDGILSSLGVFQLTALIEEEFDIDIPEEFITPDHFYSISAIWSMIQKCKK